MIEYQGKKYEVIALPGKSICSEEDSSRRLKVPVGYILLRELPLEKPYIMVGDIVVNSSTGYNGIVVDKSENVLHVRSMENIFYVVLWDVENVVKIYRGSEIIWSL